MTPGVDNWFSGIPPKGTKFRLNSEGSRIVGERINRQRVGMPGLVIEAGTELRVPSDFNVLDRPDMIRLETLDRQESVEVNRGEDLFDEMIHSEGPQVLEEQAVHLERGK